jgi:dihydroceramidase
MLIATATVLHRVMTFDKSLTVTITSGLLATAFMIAFTIWHCISDETIMHSVLFGMLPLHFRIRNSPDPLSLKRN